MIRNDDDVRGRKPPDRQCQSPEARLGIGDSGGAVCREHELRAFCCRIFGWSGEHAGLVDEVMHTLLGVVARGGVIALRGDSDLVPIAYSLHRRLFGPDRPFVVCDPRRRHGDGSVRAPANRNTGMLALEAAMGGSVCIRSNRLPMDLELLAMSLQGPGAVAALFVCLHHDDRVTDLLCHPLRIPSLAQRPSELGRLLNEYLDEAAHRLGVGEVRLSERVQQAVLEHVTSLPELEKTALRLVALTTAPTLRRAARWLNMSAVSLSRWVCHRRWAAASLGDAERTR